MNKEVFRLKAKCPGNWNTLPFGDAIKDATGGKPKVKKGSYKQNGSLAVIDQGQELIGGYIDDERLACREKLPCILFGDHTKIFKFINQPFALGADGVKVLVPKGEFDKRFLYHYLNTLKLPNNAGYSRHFKFLKEKAVVKPPLAEQKRIAAILDKAAAIRSKRRQAIQLADEFLRSVFLDMFGDPVTNPKGWKEARLDQISEIVSGVTKGRKFLGKATVLVPYMRVANVQDGHILIDDVQKIEALESEIEKYGLKQGDILLTEGGDPDKLGRGAVWKGQIDPCIHQNHIFRVRTNNKVILPEYLSALIGSQRGKRYFLKAAKQKTGVASINKTQLSGFPALIPPIESQYDYLNRLEKFDHMVDKQMRNYKESENLFNSLSQRAFRGEL